VARAIGTRSGFVEGIAMAITLTPSEQLTYSTVRIECARDDDWPSVGTGFFFSFLAGGGTMVPALVTNRHVVRGATAIRYYLHGRNADDEPDRAANLWVDQRDLEQTLIPHPDDDVDLCVLLVGHALNTVMEAGNKPFFVNLPRDMIPTDEELAALMAIEDVIMVGYPNGLWDHFNNMPVVRRGITATHPAKPYEGREEFMIDAACFAGSSGSPIFLFNDGSYPSRQGPVVGRRMKLLGILRGGPHFTAGGDVRVVDVPTAKSLVVESRIPMNLGIAIRAKQLLDFEAPIRALVHGKG
jgi:Trypsin-like peptidase domain